MVMEWMEERKKEKEEKCGTVEIEMITLGILKLKMVENFPSKLFWQKTAFSTK